MFSYAQSQRQRLQLFHEHLRSLNCVSQLVHLQLPSIISYYFPSLQNLPLTKHVGPKYWHPYRMLVQDACVLPNPQIQANSARSATEECVHKVLTVCFENHYDTYIYNTVFCSQLQQSQNYIYFSSLMQVWKNSGECQCRPGTE